MADFTLQKLKSTLSEGGARTNLWAIVFPDLYGVSSEKIQILARGASLPATTITPISINYRGRQIHFPGDQAAPVDWTVTVINDNDFAIRRALETWMNKISNYKSWTGSYESSEGKDVEVHQLDRKGVARYKYKFYSIWPTSISEIALNQDAGTIEEFTVTFKVDYFEPLDIKEA